jgi:hypothetical protein
MALVEIPVFPDLGAFNEKVVLDGTPYTLVGRFNPRMQRWVMDVQDEGGTDLVCGLPLVSDSNLTDALKGRIKGFWLGDLMTRDMTGRGRSADLETLGKDVKLFYLEPGT